MPELRAQALEALRTPECMVKVAHVAMLARADELGRLALDASAVLYDPGDLPGRPARPELIDARDVPDRGVGTDVGRAALLHAIAHIEFNAINLALDAVWRFAGLPETWYRDWLGVAAEEAYHFCLLKDRIEALGRTYGDFPAHDGLWDAARRTGGDPLARVALVPRTLEARGLDVTPSIRSKLSNAGDEESARVLDTILRDEIGHVEIGNRWYAWLCIRDGRDPETAHDELAREHGLALPRPPFNRPARIAAGFTNEQLERWNGRPRSTGRTA